MSQQKILSNGLRVVWERLPDVRSVSTGVWIAAGSRFEPAGVNGISHFIEHMLFKGTERRSAKEIAETIEDIGGEINAFTSKEFTCFYTKTLDAHLGVSMDLLSDMLFHSRFLEPEMAKEKKVVREEIRMVEDTPDECSMELLTEKAWEGDPVGWPILGVEDTLAAIARADVDAYMADLYRPDNAVIAVAGRFEEEEMLALAEKHFGSWKPVPGAKARPVVPAAFRRGAHIKRKKTEQVHLSIGFQSLDVLSDDIMVLNVVNAIFGGGMSSRLFQKIREEHGLVYAIHSYPMPLLGTGMLGIYAGMSPAFLLKTLSLMKAEIDLVRDDGFSEAEIAKAREQVKGGYILGLESTSGRMMRLGRNLLQQGKVYEIDEVIAMIDAVTPEKARRIIADTFDYGRMTVAAVGHVDRATDRALKETFWKGGLP
jgi:predicted Zn-dependent peptidase